MHTHTVTDAAYKSPGASVFFSIIYLNIIVLLTFLPAHVFPCGLGNIPVTEIGGSPFPHGGVILDVGGCPKGSVVCDPTACDDDDAGMIGICLSTSTDVLASSRKKPHS